MSTEYLSLSDKMWLDYQHRMGEGEESELKFYDAIFARKSQPDTLIQTYGIGQYQRTYSCGCSFADFCDECQEP